MINVCWKVLRTWIALFQIWVRASRLPCLCRVPWRNADYGVTSGYRHWHIHTSPSHWWQAGKFPHLKISPLSDNNAAAMIMWLHWRLCSSWERIRKLIHIKISDSSQKRMEFIWMDQMDGSLLLNYCWMAYQIKRYLRSTKEYEALNLTQSKLQACGCFILDIFVIYILLNICHNNILFRFTSLGIWCFALNTAFCFLEMSLI